MSREADRWYVSLTVEVKVPDSVSIAGEPVGIDVGLKHFAVLSTGEKIESPKSLEKNLKRLKKLSRKHSKKEKGSNNRRKSAVKLAKLHRRIRNQRTA
ncbi:transposase [Peptococcaceae bacterium]|nr:transposase [Peptococcaceae bacterium]